MISFSKENFLKQIYTNNENGSEYTASSYLAEELKVSNAAITDMSRKLSTEGLVNHYPYKGVSLTQSGRIEAMKVLRRHRLWELFLIKTLGMNWSEVHEEAERLEHFSSEILIDKIDKFLDFPHFDPHGAPIPDKSGKMPEMPELILLTEAQPGQEYRVARVLDQDPHIIMYFNRVGLFLNTRLRIMEKFDFDKSINIFCDGSEFLITEKVGQTIFLEQI
ncbi:MAG: metal-dependent transcriptional regulator [Saprospiraceae bacterium]|nr:metal-dependent transcriptional regulator [Saprospiraceae bacterium]